MHQFHRPIRGPEPSGSNLRQAQVGRPGVCLDGAAPGLGTSIVQALARQLDGRVEISPVLPGTSVSITHGIFNSDSKDCFIPLVLRSLDAAPSLLHGREEKRRSEPQRTPPL